MFIVAGAISVSIIRRFSLVALVLIEVEFFLTFRVDKDVPKNFVLYLIIIILRKYIGEMGRNMKW